MVTVYRPYFEEGYAWAMTVGDAMQTVELRSRRRGDPWKPVWMYMIMTDRQGSPRRPADMPWHNAGTMVLKDQAKRALEPVLGEDAEWLPAYDSEGEDLWLVNAWRVVDALDEEHSDVERFKSSGRIMRVRRYVLRAEALAAAAGVRCFRLPQQPSRMLVTDEVVSAVNAAGLHGTTFVPIWRHLGTFVSSRGEPEDPGRSEPGGDPPERYRPINRPAYSVVMVITMRLSPSLDQTQVRGSASMASISSVVRVGALSQAPSAGSRISISPRPIMSRTMAVKRGTKALIASVSPLETQMAPPCSA
jgi:hypothetical protein